MFNVVSRKVSCCSFGWNFGFQVGFQAIAEALGLAAVKAVAAISTIIAGGRMVSVLIPKLMTESYDL